MLSLLSCLPTGNESLWGPRLVLFLVVLYPQYLEFSSLQQLWLHSHLLNELMQLCELENSSPPPPGLGSVCFQHYFSLRSGTHHCPTFFISPCLASSLHQVHLPESVPRTSLVSLLPSLICSSNKSYSEPPTEWQVPTRNRLPRQLRTCFGTFSKLMLFRTLVS